LHNISIVEIRFKQHSWKLGGDFVSVTGCRCEKHLITVSVIIVPIERLGVAIEKL
jgi:hypothetical protein